MYSGLERPVHQSVFFLKRLDVRTQDAKEPLTPTISIENEPVRIKGHLTRLLQEAPQKSATRTTLLGVGGGNSQFFQKALNQIFDLKKRKNPINWMSTLLPRLNHVRGLTSSDGWNFFLLLLLLFG